MSDERLVGRLRDGLRNKKLMWLDRYEAAYRIEGLEELLWAAENDAKEAEAYAEELEATLKKLEYWFDTDQEILDVMGNNEKADHMRKLKMIRDALGGDCDD